MRRCTARRRSSRSTATSRATSCHSGADPSRCAATVCGRGLNTKLKLCSKRARSRSAREAAKSASVSPGKPTMKSVVTAMPGRAARRRSKRSRYSDTV